MRYALLLYADVAAARAASREQADAELERYRRITEDLADEGVLRGGEAFLPASGAVRVESSSSGPQITDVPSGRRELSGFFLVECDRDRAIQIAADLPVARHGQVEVRPLMEMPPPA